MADVYNAINLKNAAKGSAILGGALGAAYNLLSSDPMNFDYTSVGDVIGNPIDATVDTLQDVAIGAGAGFIAPWMTKYGENFYNYLKTAPKNKKPMNESSSFDVYGKSKKPVKDKVKNTYSNIKDKYNNLSDNEKAMIGGAALTGGILGDFNPEYLGFDDGDQLLGLGAGAALGTLGGLGAVGVEKLYKKGKKLIKKDKKKEIKESHEIKSNEKISFLSEGALSKILTTAGAIAGAAHGFSGLNDILQHAGSLDPETSYSSMQAALGKIGSGVTQGAIGAGVGLGISKLTEKKLESNTNKGFYKNNKRF